MDQKRYTGWLGKLVSTENFCDTFIDAVILSLLHVFKDRHTNILERRILAEAKHLIKLPCSLKGGVTLDNALPNRKDILRNTIVLSGL